MTDNAIYTPTPISIRVRVYRDDNGLHADSGPAHLAAMRGEIVGEESARVIARGNLLPSGRQRWYQVELADGSRHSVVGEGS